MKNVLIISLLGILLGYVVMFIGEVEPGLAICSAVLTGFFGYSKQTVKEHTSKQTFLVATILSVTITIYIGVLLYNVPIYREVLVATSSVSLSAITGFLAFCQQVAPTDN